jgi:hypothetical protein
MAKRGRADPDPLFSDNFLDFLKSDPIGGASQILEIASAKFEPDTQGWTQSDYDILLEAYALVGELVDSNLVPVGETYPTLTGTLEDDCTAIRDYLKYVADTCAIESSKLRLRSFRSQFRAALGTGFSYEFSQGDLDRVQTLVNEIREHISNCKSLESDHRQRLLRRLEKLQSELHKKVSDLDRFWGLVGDAGVVLGKLGNDAKPIVDRIREVAEIVWQTQSRAEELPSGTQLPLLEHTQQQDRESD